jgi:hypothetical protein
VLVVDVVAEGAEAAAPMVVGAAED